MRVKALSALLLFPVCFGLASAAEPPAPPAPAPDAIPSHVVKVLRTTNKAQVNQYVPKAYSLANANPNMVARFIRRPLEAEEGAWFTFAKPDGHGGAVLIICPPYQIPYFDRLIALIDRPNLSASTGTKRLYQRLKHRNVSDPAVVDALASYANESARVLGDPETNALFVQDAPSGHDRVVQALEQIDVPRDQMTVHATIYEVDVQDNQTLGLDFHAWKNGPGRNLFAAGAFYERDKIQLLEGSSTPIFNAGTGTYGLPGHRFEAKGANAAYYLDVPSAYFDFLATRGKARVVTEGTLTALNTEPALLEAGDQVLYYEVQQVIPKTNGIRPSGVVLDPLGRTDKTTSDPVQTAEAVVTGTTGLTGPVNLTTKTFLPGETTGKDDFPDNRTVTGKTTSRAYGSVQTGLFMKIVPVIGTEETLLAVDFTVVNHIGYQDDGKPLLDNRDLFAQVAAKDGQEIVLGGLDRVRTLKTTRKVPILGSIPVLGWLFGGEITQVQKSAVVVVLRPEIKVAGSLRPEDAKIRGQVEGETKAPLPGLKGGYDQYLLDRE